MLILKNQEHIKRQIESLETYLTSRELLNTKYTDQHTFERLETQT